MPLEMIVQAELALLRARAQRWGRLFGPSWERLFRAIHIDATYSWLADA